MIMKKQDLYNKAIQMWGIEGQVDMFHEEVGELISALNKYKRGRVGKDAVVTEIADVQIMAEQLAVWFGENEVSREKEYKLNRLARRIQQKELSDNGIATTDEGEPIEQSEVDLEKEIEEWWQNWVSPPRNEYAVFNKEEFANIARHFAECGVIHRILRKEE